MDLSKIEVIAKALAMLENPHAHEEVHVPTEQEQEHRGIDLSKIDIIAKALAKLENPQFHEEVHHE